MHKYIARVALLVCLLFTGKIYSQIQSPVKWQFSYNPIDDTSGELILKANVNMEWHIYSQLQSGDGPLPTIFSFERTPDYDLLGKVLEPNPETAYSEVFTTDVMMFSNEVVFKQKIKRSNKNTFTIMGNVECMACNNSQCLPPKKYTITIQVPSAN
jgi:hypothetical protein